MVVGGLVVLALGVLVGVLALGGSSASGASKLSDALSPVALADHDLDATLDSVGTSKQLPTVGSAAATTAATISRAQGTVSAIQAPATTKSLVEQALAANLDYVNKVSAAAAHLTAVSVSAAGNAAQRTKAAFAAVQSHDPSIGVPSGSSFIAVRQLGVLAKSTSASGAATSASLAGIRNYVHSIDALLRNSAQTRADLSALINEAQNGSIGATEARDRIAGVIAQRTTLQSQVAALSPPAPFARVAELLRSSIGASLDDDRAIQGLINAYLDGFDPSSFAAQHQDASGRATSQKQQFLVAYNKLRARYLKLAPFPLDFRY